MAEIVPIKKNGNGRSAPSKFVPDDFELSDELYEWTKKKAPYMPIGLEFERFHDYEFRRPYTDWPRVWRNWVRKWNEIDYGLHPDRYIGLYRG